MAGAQPTDSNSKSAPKVPFKTIFCNFSKDLSSNPCAKHEDLTTKNTTLEAPKNATEDAVLEHFYSFYSQK